MILGFNRKPIKRIEPVIGLGQRKTEPFSIIVHTSQEGIPVILVERYCLPWDFKREYKPTEAQWALLK